MTSSVTANTAHCLAKGVSKPAAKKATKPAGREVTFAELWCVLQRSYARNRRDYRTAYGGNTYYDQVDSLYRFGTLAPSSSLQRQPPVTAYFSASDRNTSQQANSALPPDTTARSTTNSVSYIIVTNELLTSEPQWLAVKNAYQRGVFYAILTLKRARNDDLCAGLGSVQTVNSLFAPLLLKHTLPPKARCDVGYPINPYLPPFYGTDVGAMADVFPPLTGDESNDDAASDDDLIDDEDNNREVVLPDNELDNSDVNNTNHRLTGFGYSAHSYRLESYQQFFNPFFHAIKRLPKRTRLLPHFF